MKKYEKSRENFVIQRRVEAGKVEDVNKYIEEFISKYDNVDEESVEYEIDSKLDGEGIVLIIQISFSYESIFKKKKYVHKKSFGLE